MAGFTRKRFLRTGRMEEFFSTPKRSKTSASTSTVASTSATNNTTTNSQAKALAARIQHDLQRQSTAKTSRVVQPNYLTPDGRSWYIHVKGWYPTPSRDAIDREWKIHPASRHSLQVFGRTVKEKRWSQSWGVSYAYSGAVNPGRPLSESPTIVPLLHRVNKWFVPEKDKENEAAASGINIANEKLQDGPYNGCLQNWYTPQDTIGLHADDERSMNSQYPIVSLSWGGTRRFLLRPKTKTHNSNNDVIELYLEDGDLLLMGGTCQETHKHEVPAHRITKDPPTADRINWTFRVFKT